MEEQVTLHGDGAAVGRGADETLRLGVADSGDDSWAKIRFGTAGWQAVGELLPRIEAAPARVVLYNAIRDAVRDAELDSEQALDMVLAGIAREPVELVVGELLQFATETLAGCFAGPADRPGRRARIAGLAHELLAAAAPGSDAQLEAARAGIRASDDAGWLGAWWAGDQLPSGLVIDAELRWALVTRRLPWVRCRRPTSTRRWPATRAPPGWCTPPGPGRCGRTRRPRRRPGRCSPSPATGRSMSSTPAPRVSSSPASTS